MVRPSIQWLIGASLLLIAGGCFADDGRQPAADAASRTTISSATRLHLGSSLRDGSDPEGVIHDFQRVPGDDGEMLEVVAGDDTFVEVARWELPMTHEAASPIARAALSFEDHDGVLFRWRLQRLDTCGLVRAESSTVSVTTEDGSSVGTTFLSTRWMAGDRLALVLEARRVRGDPSRPSLVELGTSGSYLELSLSDQPLTGGPGEARPRTQARHEVLVGTDASGLVAGDFRWNNQRAMWWNSRALRWDAVLPTASPPATNASDWWLWTDLAGEAHPVLDLTERPSTPDVFWNDHDCTLSVFFSRDASGTSRFHSYRYDPYVDEYQAIMEQVAVPSLLRGSRRVTIVESPNGHLWAGVNHDGAVRVSRSTDGGETWGEPVILRRTAARGDNHWVVFEDEDGDSHRVGLAVTEDGGQVLFLHLDQDDDGWHRADRWVDESHLLPAPVDVERADDELSAVAFEGEAFVVVETEVGEASRSDVVGVPQLIVYRRDRVGRWSRHVVAEYGIEWAGDLKRPTIAVDRDLRRVYVAASRSDRTASMVMSAPLGDLDAWSRHVIFETDDPARQSLYNVRLPRHPVDGSSGLLVSVVDQVSGHLWRAIFADGLSPAVTPDR